MTSPFITTAALATSLAAGAAPLTVALTSTALLAELIDNKIISGGDAPILDEGICSAPGRTVCAKSEEVRRIRAFLSGSITGGGLITDDHVIETAIKKLGVTDEAALWQHPQVRAAVGPAYADLVLKRRFKPTGPANSTALLTNIDIDNTMAQWSMLSDELFHKKFYHIPFQMIDFEKTHSELARVDLAALKAAGYDCMGTVINTDISRGPGKHWFCLYADLAHAGTESDPITIEYFNSSGNPPMLEISDWMERVSHELLRDHKIHTDLVRSAPRRLQQSHTECGVWSLLYIRERLEGNSPTWYYDVGANDSDMIAARARLFR